LRFSNNQLQISKILFAQNFTFAPKFLKMQISAPNFAFVEKKIANRLKLREEPCACHNAMYTVGHKKCDAVLLSISSPIINHFQNSLTSKLCRQSAITGLLYIPPHSKCVSTLPCEIQMSAKTKDNNKNLGK